MSRLAALDLAAKVALVALLAHAAVFPHLVQYQHKGMGYRLALYPLAALVVPVVWRLRPGPPGTPYPYLIDLLVVAPFLFDTAGNAANLYDRIVWWDKAMHVVNWVPLVCAFGLFMRSRGLGRLNVAALTVGFGAVTHILWEIAEYLTFVQTNPNEAASAYQDTIKDLAASLTGSLVGGILVSTVLWDAGRRNPVATPSVADVTTVAP
jgi:hypothetical protein